MSNDSSPSYSILPPATWQEMLARALVRPRNPRVALGEVRPNQLWSSALLAQFPERQDQVDAISRALRDERAAPLTMERYAHRVPGLEDAIRLWESMGTSTGAVDFRAITALADPALAASDWVQHWLGQTFPAAPLHWDEVPAYRWARATAKAAALADVPKDVATDSVAVCRLAASWMRTTVYDLGESWKIVGLRGPAPAQSARASLDDPAREDAAFDRFPWGELLAFVSADQPSPAGHDGERWPYTIQVPKDQVLEQTDLRRMPVVLAALGSQVTERARKHRSTDAVTMLPLVLVDMPLAEGLWSGHVYAMRDLPDVHVELQLTPPE